MGPIPQELSLLVNLQGLYMRVNHLSGLPSLYVHYIFEVLFLRSVECTKRFSTSAVDDAASFDVLIANRCAS